MHFCHIGFQKFIRKFWSRKLIFATAYKRATFQMTTIHFSLVKHPLYTTFLCNASYGKGIFVRNHCILVLLPQFELLFCPIIAARKQIMFTGLLGFLHWALKWAPSGSPPSRAHYCCCIRRNWNLKAQLLFDISFKFWLFQPIYLPSPGPVLEKEKRSIWRISGLLPKKAWEALKSYEFFVPLRIT